MNSMIRHLRRENNLTEEGLKQLYRRLCKETHPDLKGGDGERFRKLKSLYEEALQSLRHGSKSEPVLSREERRYRILKLLYIYSIKFRGQYSQKLLASLIDETEEYDRSLHKILIDYRELIFIPFSRLKPDADFYWTHSLFIRIVPQLVDFYRYPIIIYERICRSYLADLKKRAEKLGNGDFKRIFLFLAKWLEDEMDGEKVIIMS